MNGRLVIRLTVAVITFATGVSVSSCWNALRHDSALTMQSVTATEGTHSIKPLDWQLCPANVTDSSIRGIELRSYSVNYGDVTGDGVEEAMIATGIPSYGSAITWMIYVYGLENQKLKILWQFESGDRAYGGFKAIYAHCGDVIVELEGPNATPEDPYAPERAWPLINVPDGGACCASHFTRTRYQWKGGRFRRKGLPEIFPLGKE